MSMSSQNVFCGQPLSRAGYVRWVNENTFLSFFLPFKLASLFSFGSDTEKAMEAWQRYKSREKSHISELFVGQLKSTLECCTCGFKSVTFDPFWDLSLPIPRVSATHSSVNAKMFYFQSYTLS